MAFNIVLVEPEIPQNAGNIARTCAAIGAKLTGRIPVIGPGLAVVTGFVGGMVGYFGGSKLGDCIS